MSYTPTAPSERGEILVPEEMELGEKYLEVVDYELGGQNITVGIMKERGFVPRYLLQVEGGAVYSDIPSPGIPGPRDPAEEEALEDHITVMYYELPDKDEEIAQSFEVADAGDLFKTVHLTDQVVREIKSMLEEHGYDDGK